MTEQKRLQRVRLLLAHVAEGCSEAVAWRKANPRNKASDKSAAEMFRREMRWIARRWMKYHPAAPAPASDWWQEPKQCIGVDDRPCGKEIPRWRKRCPTCATEQDRLNRRGYGRTYYRSHREPANTKRNERRGRQHQRERDAAAAAAKRAEEERRAKLPRPVEYNGKKYLYDPKTGEWKIWGSRDFYAQAGEFVPVPQGYPVPPVPSGVPARSGRRQRQREASQRGIAPRADRRSSKQQNLPASSGKKRKAEANEASPKSRCKTCAHPERAAIDAELLRGVSLRTVGGRHGISSSAEWDGAEWQRIPAPRRKHLKEVKGRPSDIPRRTDWSIDLNCFVTRRVYRRRRSR